MPTIFACLKAKRYKDGTNADYCPRYTATFMNLYRISALTVAIFFAFASPSYAMIELLPFFFAGMALLIVGTAVVCAALVKAPLLRLLMKSRVRVPVKAVIAVTAVEFIALAVSVLACLHQIGSSGPIQSDSAAAFFLVFFGCSTSMYCVFAILPNLYLLGKGGSQTETDALGFRTVAFAIALALPTPIFAFTLAVMLYLAAR